ncbi:beta-ketoacyl synthase N-terminal-like domain-containing protein [Ruminococcus sp.]|uniref:beta-ketoacyl synthase N-terminal-like domain-containing protein n=1 Tax=Ruminococcus sp. TaxID=41978 RepID=UPI002C139638|nr:beta-ketoacyl synthase N-terminal-like domain-containing protein [Ruminococcus sp.]HNZ99583.1 beta-ketoacyl synthase N-terminal-like domain-containing protein [Ruminococcus sp.]HOH86345.1 beta-ketoacyl synthase N-terminal-like domain-containing protein [Ruminococcus sp.]
MKSRIAVIGINFRLPNADSRQQLHWNLMRKKSAVRELDGTRTRFVNDPVTEKQSLAFLDDIDVFDNSFFDISNREARNMCPEMRLSLTCAAGAVLDAGYSLKELRGSNCGVIVSQSDTNYELGIEERDGFSFTGNLPAMTSGNIAYYLDLRGPNMVVSSACASTLLGVHEAAVMLVTGQADLVLAGGAELARLDRGSVREVKASGIVSPSGCCRPFDTGADGTVSGEGAGFVLLKRYEDAVRDGDHIYGCILSSAVNGNGARSGNPTAPSAQAQAEVIARAWRDAELTSDDITEIEAHGTGTRIGDPAETEGIACCMSGDRREKPVYVSALKSNLGHLGNMAGLAALIKVLTGFENNVCYPVAGLETPVSSSADLAFLSSPVIYSGGERRIAGISAFAFNGTNVHITVENHISDRKPAEVLSEKNRLLKVSVKNRELAESYIRSIYESLSEGTADINDVVYTLNRGRDDYGYRCAFTFDSPEECLQKLCACTPVECGKIAVFTCGDAALAAELSALGVKFGENGIALPEGISDSAEALAFCYSHGADIDWAAYYEGCGFRRVSLPCNIMSEKHFWYKNAEAAPAVTADDVKAEELSISEILLEECRRALDMPQLGENDSLFDCGANSMTLMELVKKLNSRGIDVKIGDLYAHETTASLGEYLENRGETADEPSESADITGTLPAVTEDDLSEAEVQPAAEEAPASGDKKDLKQALLDSCRRALDDSSLTEDDSLFDAGINSMSMMMVIDDIAAYDAELSVEDFYECETVRELAEHLSK